MKDTLHILVVDDEPGMLLGAERALRGFTVDLHDVGTTVQFTLDQAVSGEEALEKIQALPPQILLLDHKLPGISGLEMLTRLSALGVETLTVMITAFASLETAVEATKRGAYDFLAKPFTPAELRNAVRKAAGRIVFERKARQLAREKRQVRFEFISVLAHELKAPLGAIEGYLRLIKDHLAGPDPAAYQHMLDRSLLRLEAMRKLIVDLLDLTRIESGRKHRRMEDLDLREMARAGIEPFAAEGAGRQIAIRLHAPAEVPLHADRGEIEIILNNLLSNAVKYNRDGGKVDVRVRADGRQAVLAVTDSGIGLSAEEVGRLFEDFSRIVNEKTRHILGSGLGLAIVKKLAQLYGGGVAVASTPGEGSTFTVTLDRRPPPEADRGPA